jgi:hypothetical protein
MAYKMTRYFSIWPGVLAIFYLTVFGSACSEESASEESATTSVDLTGYNHTVKGIGRYSVSVDGKSGTEAGYLGPGQGGGGYTCCVSVPSVWRPGMTVIVHMTTTGEHGEEKTITRVVGVPKYDSRDVGFVAVHFLYSGEIKVFVTKYLLGHRAYPLKGKEAERKPGVPLKIIWE